MVERIKSLCDQNGLTFKTLEKELGLGNGTVRNWDDSKPSVDRVALVAKRFGVTIDYLYWGDNPVADPTADLKFALFGGDRNISDEMYDEVKRFARFIKLQRGED